MNWLGVTPTTTALAHRRRMSSRSLATRWESMARVKGWRWPRPWSKSSAWRACSSVRSGSWRMNSKPASSMRSLLRGEKPVKTQSTPSGMRLATSMPRVTSAILMVSGAKSTRQAWLEERGACRDAGRAGRDSAGASDVAGAWRIVAPIAASSAGVRISALRAVASLSAGFSWGVLLPASAVMLRLFVSSDMGGPSLGPV